MIMFTVIVIIPTLLDIDNVYVCINLSAEFHNKKNNIFIMIINTVLSDTAAILH